MNKKMKILTVCNKGNCRSVGTRYCLYKRGYKNVIATGATVTPIETLQMLCDWADKILIAKPKHAKWLPKNAQSKIDKKFTIGEDVWHNPMSYKLHDVANHQLDLIKLI